MFPKHSRVLVSCLGITALLGTALAVVAPAVAADAAVPGLVEVQATSANNSVGKSVTVTCPAGNGLRVSDARSRGRSARSFVAPIENWKPAISSP